MDNKNLNLTNQVALIQLISTPHGIVISSDLHRLIPRSIIVALTTFIYNI